MRLFLSALALAALACSHSDERANNQIESAARQDSLAATDSIRHVRNQQQPVTLYGRRDGSITSGDTASLAAGDYDARWNVVAALDAQCSIRLALHRSDGATDAIPIFADEIGAGGTARGSVALRGVSAGRYAVEGSANCYWSLVLSHKWEPAPL